ncbi:uncharacterized protein KGF55_004710 [Candida pseudojiufengensis]|uniref:uncharacterized protein n=1 Tax=Candida pseudojiufengensis TaxID=497109 RepID=UPI0022257997|nr:uncharacterized protein KGF55_004710 [Candida pseudojiufengensis]KAI5960418.1 hypothetical protein KGF55_004710 [Candida pseudojiufengensis]
MPGLLSYLIYSLNISIFSIWAYLFIFNNNLISRYYSSNQEYIPRSQINEFITSNLRNKKQLNILLIELDKDDMEQDEEINLSHSKLHSKQSLSKEIASYGNYFIGIVFSLTLSLSIGLIILMMCELGNYVNHDTRVVLFKLTIDTLILLLVLIVPVCSINLIINQNLTLVSFDRVKAIFTLIACVLWFLVLHKCGDLTQDFNPRSSLHANTRNIVERKINEISIVGITILAILSGIGSISTPYRAINFQLLWKKYFIGHHDIKTSQSCKQPNEISTVDINTAIQNYNNTSNLLSKRKSELNRLELSNGGTIYNLPSQNLSTDNFLTTKSSETSKKLGSLLHKVQSFAHLPLKGNSEEEELKQEIASLESLKKSLYKDTSKLILKLHENQQVNLRQSKIFDKFIMFGNTILSIYCVYRIFNVFLIKLPLLYIYGESYDYDVHSDVIDVENETPTSKDALAITISKLIKSVFTNVPLTESQLVNQLSFILSGSLFICSFTNVLTTFKSFSKMFHISTNKSIESNITKNWLKHLLVAELVGVYVIATALLIRINLPENLSNQISKILSLSGSSLKNNNSSIKEVMFIENWFDKIFALSCLLTMLILILKKFIDDDKDLDFQSGDTFDEESFMESREDYKLA